MAKEMIDIALQRVSTPDFTGYDVVIKNGDFVMAESTDMHQELLLVTNTGEWKDSPLVGIGAFKYLDDDNGYNGLIAETARQFTRDGMTVKSIGADGNNIINVEANYK